MLEKDYELARGSGELMSWEKMWSSQAAYECKKCKPPSSSQLVGYWLQVARFNNSLHNKCTLPGTVGSTEDIPS